MPANRPLLLLLTLLILCVGIGALAGTLFPPGSWYAEQVLKPAWTPPDWVFAPVWTLLYVMMAVAMWLVAMTPPGAARTRATAVWVTQLALNFLWSGVFFGLHRTGWALLELSLLWIAIAATLWRFFELRPLAGWLMFPYLLWVSFAWLLNDAIWRLNGGGIGRLFSG